MNPEVARLIEQLKLEPLEAEGGYFRQTWRAATSPDSDRPMGTCIYALQTNDPDSFSAMHRLPTDEIWHFYLGDPFMLLLLHADGSVTEPVLGPDILRGQLVQLVVRAGTWMGGRLAAGGSFCLFGCTMAPGFTEADYEGGSSAMLVENYPNYEARIRSLVRDGGSLSMSTLDQA
jgi:uncharacterized protein